MRWKYNPTKPGDKRQVWCFAFLPVVCECTQTGEKYWVWFEKYLADEEFVRWEEQESWELRKRWI